MKDTDKAKIGDAMNTITNLEGQITNLAKRAPEAAKAFEADVARLRGIDEDWGKQLKEQVIPACKHLSKNAKAAIKDLKSLHKAGDEARKKDKYATGKEFREKNAKLLASAKTYEGDTLKYTLAYAKLTSMVKVPLLDDNVDVRTTGICCEAVQTYVNAIKIDLGKLT